MQIVLDSWPVLEWLQGREPATSHFRHLIESALRFENDLLMSRINRGEVFYCIRKNFPTNRQEDAWEAFLELPIVSISPDDALVDQAALLKSRTSMSYADCFAAALAMRMNSEVATGDQEFLVLQPSGLRIRWMAA